MNYMCSLMMISDMLSKHVGAVKSVLKKRFKIKDIQLVHLLVVWYLVSLENRSLYSCSLRDLLVHSSPDSETYICVIAGGIEGTEWSHRIQGGTPNPVQARPAEVETACLSQSGRVDSRLWRQYHRSQRLLRPWNHERHPCCRHNPRKLFAQPYVVPVLRIRHSNFFLVQDRQNSSTFRQQP